MRDPSHFLLNATVSRVGRGRPAAELRGQRREWSRGGIYRITLALVGSARKSTEDRLGGRKRLWINAAWETLRYAASSCSFSRYTLLDGPFSRREPK